jgi:uncharacterized delta-60 repeat protein/RHS repeat-associated protein
MLQELVRAHRSRSSRKLHKATTGVVESLEQRMLLSTDGVYQFDYNPFAVPAYEFEQAKHGVEATWETGKDPFSTYNSGDSIELTLTKLPFHNVTPIVNVFLETIGTCSPLGAESHYTVSTDGESHLEYTGYISDDEELPIFYLYGQLPKDDNNTLTISMMVDNLVSTRDWYISLISVSLQSPDATDPGCNCGGNVETTGASMPGDMQASGDLQGSVFVNPATGAYSLSTGGVGVPGMPSALTTALNTTSDTAYSNFGPYPNRIRGMQGGVPFLVHDRIGTGDDSNGFQKHILEIRGGSNPQWFNASDSDVSAVSPMFPLEDSIEHSADDSEYILTGNDGNVYHYQDFGDAYPDGEDDGGGRLNRIVDAYGNDYDFAYNMDGTIDTIDWEYTDADGNNVTQEYAYAYSTSKLASVTVTKTVGTAGVDSPVTLGEADYVYYSADVTDIGNADDLKTITIKDGSSDVLGVTLYRYYTSDSDTGYKHAVKYIIGPDAYQRLDEAVSDPATESNANVAPYASYYLEYDADHKIAKQTSAGSGGSGGLGTSSYERSTSGNGDDVNHWKYKQVETHPDGNRTLTYTNYLGATLLTIEQELDVPKVIVSISHGGAGGLTATVTAPGHGLLAGDTVIVEGASPSTYNGVFTVATVSGSSFTYTLPSDPGSNASGSSMTCARAPSSITHGGTGGLTATVTMDHHGFSNGDAVIIADASPSVYNGVFAITVVDANTFTFTLPSDPGADAGGTFTCIKILRQWGTLNQYNSDDQVTLTAQPSAVIIPNNYTILEGYSDLLHKDGNWFEYLNDTAGEVDTYTYGSSTSATDTLPGDDTHHVKEHYVKRGEMAASGPTKSISSLVGSGGGTATVTATAHGFSDNDYVLISGASPAEFNGVFQISGVSTNSFQYVGGSNVTATGTITAVLVKEAILQSTTDYYKFSSNGKDIFPVADQTIYSAEDGAGGRETSYAYTFYQDDNDADTLAMKSMITTRQTISEDSNGPDEADVEAVYYDRHGNVAWTKDANGFLTYTSHDPASGAPVLSIQDASSHTYQIATFTPNNVEIGDVFVLTARGFNVDPVEISFAATVATASNVVSGLVLAWNANSDPLTDSITASADGDNIVLTADAAGKSFDVFPKATDGGSTNNQTFTRTAFTPATPAGVSAPMGTRLNLTSSMEVDQFGRTTKMTDPNGNVTYTFYDDANHTVRVYAGWNSSNHTSTGPTQVSRQDLANGYSENFTMAATPAYDGGTGAPTGTEPVSNILSLSRSYANAAGQVTQEDRYFDFTFSTSSISSLSQTGGVATATTGSAHGYHIGDRVIIAGASPSGYDGVFTITDVPSTTTFKYEVAPAISGSASGTITRALLLGAKDTNYYSTTYAFDSMGRQNKMVSDLGTITRTVYDALGRTVSTWVGTDDTGATDADPSGGSAAGNNMVKVSQMEYDGGGVGDGNVTQTTAYPNDGSSDRLTTNLYDWRDRLVATRVGDNSTSYTSTDNAHPVTYLTYDNLGEVTYTYVYDGDTATISDSNSDGVPDQPSSSLLRAKTGSEYDEQGRVFVSHIYSVDPSNGCATSASLSTYTWFDHNGNVIKTQQPGGIVNKMIYDGANRATISYTTDGGSDHAATVSGSWSDAGTITGDIVLEQVENTYDSDGNVILQIDRQRYHDATATGALGTPTSGTAARVYYSESYYDAANRPITSVNLGTNNAAAMTAPHPTIPTRSIASSTTDSSGTNHTLIDSTLSGTADSFIGYTVTFTSGSNNGSTATVTAYDNSSHTLTLSPNLGATVASSVTYQLKLDAQINDTEYDDANRVVISTDPKGIVSKTYFDALGQTTKTIQNYVDGTPSAADDLTTSYTYDGDGHMITQTANLPSSKVQTTAYVYGEATQTISSLTHSTTTATASVTGHGYKVGESVTISGANHSEYNGTFVIASVPNANSFTYTMASDPGADASGTITARRATSIYSYDFLSKIEYPPPSTLSGDASADPVNDESFTYNAIGEKLTSADRNGNVHSYVYDYMGRLLHDRVVAYGSNEDTAVLRLSYTYNTQMLPEFSYAYNNATVGSGTVVNQTKRTYNGLGQLTGDYQLHSSGGISSFTPSVQYVYSEMADEANHSRLTKIIYPNGKVIYYRYGLSGSLNDTISRLDNLAEPNVDQSGFNIIESYKYLGSDTLVKRTRPNGNQQLSQIDRSGTNGAPQTTPAGDQYTLDRFGRITDQYWSTIPDSLGSASAIDEFKYAYDADGNVLSKTNQVSASNSELYTYDNLNRLTGFSRGTISGGTISTPSHSQGFTMDALGNIGTLAVDGPTSQTRTFNAQNEIDSLSGGAATPTFDSAGNTTVDDADKHFVYNPWNQLVTVKDTNANSNTTLESYKYDPYGRRVSRAITSSGVTTTTDDYFTAQWQLAEERIFGTTKKQYLWSPFYVDDLIERDRDSDTGGNDGALDTSFDTDGKVTTDNSSADDVANAVITLADGKVLAGGYSGNDFAIFKYNANGSLDTSFGTSGKKIVDIGSSTTDKAYAMALQQDGKILVAGISGTDFAVIRLTSAGALDMTFNLTGKETINMGGTDTVYAISLDCDFNIYLSGSSGTSAAIAEIDPTGAPVNAFDTDGKVTFHTTGTNTQVIRASGVSWDNYLYVAGNDSTAGTYFLARITSAGGLDTGFNSGGYVTRSTITYNPGSGSASFTPSAYALAFQDDGKVVVAGTASNNAVSTNGRHPTFMFAMRFLHEYNGSTVIDSTFNSGGEKIVDFGINSNIYASANALSITNTGKVYLAGGAINPSCCTSSTFAVSRLTSTGGLDTSFDSDGMLTTSFSGFSFDQVNAAAILSNGKFIAAGQASTSSGGSNDFALAKYNAPNGLDERVYAQHDANYNITALTDTFGTVIERYLYDSYGKRSITDASYSSRGSSSYSFDFGFQGGQYVANAELMIFRNRFLSTSLQRWITIDPAHSDINFYEAYLARPSDIVDPYGLKGHLPNTDIYDTEVIGKDVPKGSTEEKEDHFVTFTEYKQLSQKLIDSLASKAHFNHVDPHNVLWDNGVEKGFRMVRNSPLPNAQSGWLIIIQGDAHATNDGCAEYKDVHMAFMAYTVVFNVQQSNTIDVAGGGQIRLPNGFDTLTHEKWHTDGNMDTDLVWVGGGRGAIKRYGGYKKGAEDQFTSLKASLWNPIIGRPGPYTDATADAALRKEIDKYLVDGRTKITEAGSFHDANQNYIAR